MQKYESQTRSLNDKLSAVRSQHSELAAELKATQSSQRDLQAQSTGQQVKLTSELRSVKSKLQRAEDRLLQQMAEMQECEEIMSRDGSTIESLSRKLDNYRGTNDKLSEQIASMERQLVDAKAGLTDEHAKVNKLKLDFDDVSAALRHANEKSTALSVTEKNLLEGVRSRATASQTIGSQPSIMPSVISFTSR